MLAHPCGWIVSNKRPPLISGDVGSVPLLLICGIKSYKAMIYFLRKKMETVIKFVLFFDAVTHTVAQAILDLFM